jgi:chitin synthase
LDHFYYLNNQHLTTEDEVHFGDLKTAFKTCGFKASTVTAMFQLLSAILHMGNLQFTEPEDSMVQDACAVKNVDVLQAVAALLGVSPHKLETALTYKLRLIRNELCTVFLNPRAAAEQRDAFACALYHSLFVWIVENLNTKLCHGDPANFIGLMDLPGFQNFSKTDDNGFEQFCFNFANERLHQFLIQQQFNDDSEAIQDGLVLPKVLTMDNVGCLDLLGGNNGSNGGTSGLVGAVNKASAKYQNGATDATDANLLADMQRQYNGQPSFISAQSFSFGIHHYGGTVHYSVDRFLDRNMDSMSPDFVSLLRDHSSNNFVSSLFQSMAMATESHPKDDRTIVKAQLTSKPTRAPSMRRKTTKRLQRKNTTKQTIPEESEAMSPTTTAAGPDASPDVIPDEEIKVSTVLDQLYTTLSDLFVTMAGTQIYNVIHIRPNDMQSPDTLDSNRVKNQLRSFLISDLALRRSKEYVINYTYGEFVTRYDPLIASMVDTTNKHEREQVDSLYAFLGWHEHQAYLGRGLIWLAYEPWKELEDGLRVAEKEARAKAKGETTGEMAAMGGGLLMGATADNGARQDMHTLPLSHDDPSSFGPPPPGFAGGEHHPGYSGHDDSYLLAPPQGTASMYGGSYAASEDGNRRDDMASQWGDESEWGINGLGEG